MLSLYLLLWLASYLFGGIPFAYLVAWFKGVNLFEVGSGNIGATNVGRALGRNWGILVFILDFFKGVIPTLTIRPLAELLSPGAGEPFGIAELSRVGAASLALLGHIYPIYLRFKGGKGVATGAGVALVLMPLPMISALVIWLVVLAISRFVSLASILAAAVLILVRLVTEPHPICPDSWLVTVFCLFGSCFVILKHRDNVRRLLQGTEAKIGKKSRSTSPTSTTS